MNRPDQDRHDTTTAAEGSPAAERTPADNRFWQAFAQAGGFDDELRELIASGDLDAEEAGLSAFGSGDDLTSNDLLAADRLHELLLAARTTSVEPGTVELAPRRSTDDVGHESRRSYGMLAVLSLLTLASVAAIAMVVVPNEDGTGAGAPNAEVASAERLAEEWIALREEAPLRDVALPHEVEFDADPTVDAFDFEETPDWLVVAIAAKAGLAADAVEEAAQ